MNDYTKVQNGLLLSDELTEYYTVVKNEFEGGWFHKSKTNSNVLFVHNLHVFLNLYIIN